jgi:hypothetical protein
MLTLLSDINRLIPLKFKYSRHCVDHQKAEVVFIDSIQFLFNANPIQKVEKLLRFSDFPLHFCSHFLL